jgi:hypothetical protein
MEVAVAEAVGHQQADFDMIPETVMSGCALDMPSFTMKGEVKPAQCPSALMQDEPLQPSQHVFTL